MASRRTFLKSVAAATTVPAVLWGCGNGHTDDLTNATRGSEAAHLPRPMLPPVPDAEPIVRVRIRRMTAAEAERGVLVGQRDEWIRILHRVPLATGDQGDAMAEREIMVDRAHLARGPVNFSALERSWSVIDADGRAVRTRAFETLLVEPLDPESRLMRVGSEMHPGTLRFVARPDLGPGEYDVVAHVKMEAYLPGVLARELYSHWNLQAFAAQAIAARSFAASEIATSVNQRHFDVTNTTASQAYSGNTDQNKAHEAVRMTRGVMLSYGSGLVSGYYSACCGGVAASALDVISDHPIHDIPPLMGRSGEDVCHQAPVYQWNITRPTADVLARVRAFGNATGQLALADVSTIESIEPSQHNAHGRPTHYALHVTGPKQLELRADELRRAMDFTSEALRLSAPPKRLFSSFFEVSVTGGEVMISGRGHGHGAGMCQYGAQALATSGTAFEDILHWYYPTTELMTGYS